VKGKTKNKTFTPRRGKRKRKKTRRSMASRKIQRGEEKELPGDGRPSLTFCWESGRVLEKQSFLRLEGRGKKG